MLALQDAQLLEVWERGRRAHPVDRGLQLLNCALPGASRDELAALSVGRRDALLHELRSERFGERMDVQAACPRCAKQLEFALSLPQAAAGEGEPLELSVDRHRMRLRAPNSFDLAAAASCADVVAARRALFERCVEAAWKDGNPTEARDLPEICVAAAGDAISRADPASELLLDLACPACGHCWQNALDIVSFLWTELEACAQRLLLEVHDLASAYGWTEAEVLALGAARRESYLMMARA